MVRHTLKILQQMLTNVSDHFGTLCIKGLSWIFHTEFFHTLIISLFLFVCGRIEISIWFCTIDLFNVYLQKWSLEVLFKHGVMKTFAKFTLKNQCRNLSFKKFLYNSPQLYLNLKRNSGTDYSCKFCNIFQGTCFKEQLRVIFSISSLMIQKQMLIRFL